MEYGYGLMCLMIEVVTVVVGVVVPVLACEDFITGDHPYTQRLRSSSIGKYIDVPVQMNVVLYLGVRACWSNSDVKIRKIHACMTRCSMWPQSASYLGENYRRCH